MAVLFCIILSDLPIRMQKNLHLRLWVKIENFMTVRKGYVLRGSIAVTAKQACRGGQNAGVRFPGRNDFGQNGRYISILKRRIPCTTIMKSHLKF